MHELSKIIYSIAAFQLFFMAWVVLFYKPAPTARYGLSAFLLLKSLLLMLILGRWYYPVIPPGQGVQLIHQGLELFLHPIFFLFVLTASYQPLPRGARILPALIPFAVFAVLASLPIAWQNTPYVRLLGIINYYSQALVYFFLALKRYQSFRNEMRNYLSEDLIQNLRWLSLCIYGFIALWGIAAFLDVLNLYLEADYPGLNLVLEILFLATIHVVLFLGMRQPEAISDAGVLNASRGKYASSKLNESDKEAILSRLAQLMQNEHLYRTPNLTLKLLSERLQVPDKHLSQVINECCGQNFCEYINRLRIEEAKLQLCHPGQAHKTVLEILYETGFNSKSVFNTLFKQHTGETPTRYRRNQHRVADH